jgi:hypothetical protein
LNQDAILRKMLVVVDEWRNELVHCDEDVVARREDYTVSSN